MDVTLLLGRILFGMLFVARVVPDAGWRGRIGSIDGSRPRSPSLW